jgi:hypothetical protein
MEKQTKPKSRLKSFFEKRPVLAVSGVISLILAYVFASLAIDSGSLLDYAITFLLIFVGIRDLSAALFRKGGQA